MDSVTFPLVESRVYVKPKLTFLYSPSSIPPGGGSGPGGLFHFKEMS